MLVSVVIPCTNRIKGLERSIRSVLNQNFEGCVEIFLIENNSADRTEVVSLVSKLSDARVRHYYIEDCDNANVARNFGAKLANGDYIAFLDSDDEWLDCHLRTCLALICDNGGVFSSFYSVAAKSHSVVGGAFSGDIEYDLFVSKSVDIRTSVLFFLKSSFIDVMFDERLNKHQDWGLAVDFQKVHSLVYSSKPTVRIYTDCEGRMSAKTNFAASLFFLENKISGHSRNNFIISRMADEISIGSIESLRKYIQVLDFSFFGVTTKKKIAYIMFYISSLSKFSFYVVRNILYMYKSIFVANK